MRLLSISALTWFDPATGAIVVACATLTILAVAMLDGLRARFEAQQEAGDQFSNAEATLDHGEASK